MEINVIGIDLAKSVFQVHGVDVRGKAVLRKRLSRSQFLPFLANLPRCLVGMEACGSAHHWAREIQKLGHEVRLISPQFVKPYVKSNKNDAADAEAICEAVARPHMRFVAIKTIEQQDIQALHRARQQLVYSRTALINELRGLLAEYGIIFSGRATRLRNEAAEFLRGCAEQERLTTIALETFQDLASRLGDLSIRIQTYDRRIQAIYRAHPVCRRIGEVPGVGPLTATALIAAVGNPHAFKNGRQLSAWLGLVPRQYSSGSRERLLGISKRGDVYLRTLLIHGARTVIRWVDLHPEEKQFQWLRSLIDRRGVNRATVALANKNARRIWVLMAREVEYMAA